MKFINIVLLFNRDRYIFIKEKIFKWDIEVREFKLMRY